MTKEIAEQRVCRAPRLLEQQGGAPRTLRAQAESRAFQFRIDGLRDPPQAAGCLESIEKSP